MTDLGEEEEEDEEMQGEMGEKKLCMFFSKVN